jgi:primosomal protein N'
VARVRNQYRWNIILKTADPAGSALRLKKILGGARRPSGVNISADVDPISV